jgi:hypothetical protein
LYFPGVRDSNKKITDLLPAEARAFQMTGITVRQFRLSPYDIVLMQYLLEGYEGLFSVTTLDPAEARIEVAIMPDFFDDAKKILDALHEDVLFAEAEPLMAVSPCPC